MCSIYCPPNRTASYTYMHVGVCMNIVSVYCSIPTDPSLIPSNLTSALDLLPEGQWKTFGDDIDVPASTVDKIKSQYHSNEERKAAVIRVYLIENPHPTWDHVSDTLYKLSGGQYHNVLEKLQSLFPTGEHIMCEVYHHSWVSTLPLMNPQSLLCVSSDAVYSAIS